LLKAAKNGRICHDFGESRNAPLRDNPDRRKPLLGMGRAQTFYAFFPVSIRQQPDFSAHCQEK